MSANDHQVGGNHYLKHGELQHWDVAGYFNFDYFQGQVTKYLFRWRDKGGVEDLKKARHYLDKYIELEEAKLKSLGTTKGSGFQVVESEEVVPLNQVRPKLCPQCQKVGSMITHGRPDPNCPYCHGRGGDRELQAASVVFEQKTEARFEPCCECGNDYPREDLLAGHIFCLKCRDPKNPTQVRKDIP